jgi:hypothetical protein
MYNKKALSKATAELDKAKAPAKPKDIITDPMGQWKYPGQITRIPSNDITMKGVGYPVVGVADTGQRQIMLPGADYTFPGADYVDEYPQMKKGGTKKRKTKSLSGTNKLLEVNELFKNYKNREFDPKAKHFQEGGTSKNNKGTVTNVKQNPDGSETVQVKTKNGKYYEKVIPMDYWGELDKAKENYNIQKADERFNNYAGTVVYPAAIASSIVDIRDGDYGDAAIGLVPFVGKKTKAAQVVRRNTLKKAYKLGLSNKTAQALRKSASHTLVGGSGVAQGYDVVFQEGGYIETELTPDEIEEYRKGGFIVEDISVPELNQAKKGLTGNPNKSPKPSVYVAKNDKDYAFRQKAYDDSLSMYKLGTLNNMLAKNYERDPDISEKEQIEYMKKNDAYIQKMKKIKAQSSVKLGDVFGKPARPTQMIVEPYKTEAADIIDKRAPKPGVKKVNVDKAMVKDSVRQLEQPAAKLIEKSITQPVKQPVVKQSKYPEGYQPYSLYGKVLDPEVYGYAESLNDKPVQVSQFADTYGYKAKMDTYKKSGKYPWVKQKGGMVVELTPDEIQDYINQGYIVEDH